MKNQSKKLRIVPRGVVELHNGESAMAGEGAELVNMREREEALEVVGEPEYIGQLNAGDKVLLVDEDRTLVLRGNSVMWGSSTVASPAGTVLGAHRVGPLLVVVTDEGKVMMRRTSSGYEVLDPMGAIPQIHISAAEVTTMTTQVAAYDFASPYTTWQVPLSSADLESLTKIMCSAEITLQSQATSQGRFTGVLLARYAVRLWDDSYLWMSQPVMIGHGIISNSYRTTATVTTSGNSFTGIESCNEWHLKRVAALGQGDRCACFACVEFGGSQCRTGLPLRDNDIKWHTALPARIWSQTTSGDCDVANCAQWRLARGGLDHGARRKRLCGCKHCHGVAAGYRGAAVRRGDLAGARSAACEPRAVCTSDGELLA